MEDTFNGLQGGGDQPEEGDLEIWVSQDQRSPKDGTRTAGRTDLSVADLGWVQKCMLCGPASIEFQRQSQDAC